MIKKNFLKNKLDMGNAVIGTWSIIPSPVVADIISQSGLDFVILDNEHGPASFETIQNMMMACELSGVSPMYRPSGVSEPEILKGLDIGAHGIQVPNVNSLNQLSEIIQFSKFPPKGNRGFSPFVRAAGYSNLNSDIQVKRANENILIGINLEGEEGIKNIEAFLDVDELDIIFIGTFDLSKVMGIPGNVEHPKVVHELKRLTKITRDKGKHVGTITTSKSMIERYKDFGMNYIVHYVDCEILRSGYADALNAFKN